MPRNRTYYIYHERAVPAVSQPPGMPKLRTASPAPVAHPTTHKMAEVGRRRLPDGAVRADGPAACMLYVWSLRSRLAVATDSRVRRPRPTPTMSIRSSKQPLTRLWRTRRRMKNRRFEGCEVGSRRRRGHLRVPAARAHLPCSRNGLCLSLRSPIQCTGEVAKKGNGPQFCPDIIIGF